MTPNLLLDDTNLLVGPNLATVFDVTAARTFSLNDGIAPYRSVDAFTLGPKLKPSPSGRFPTHVCFPPVEREVLTSRVSPGSRPDPRARSPRPELRLRITQRRGHAGATELVGSLAARTCHERPRRGREGPKEIRVPSSTRQTLGWQRRCLPVLTHSHSRDTRAILNVNFRHVHTHTYHIAHLKRLFTKSRKPLAPARHIRSVYGKLKLVIRVLCHAGAKHKPDIGVPHSSAHLECRWQGLEGFFFLFSPEFDTHNGKGFATSVREW